MQAKEAKRILFSSLSHDHKFIFSKEKKIVWVYVCEYVTAYLL